MTIAELAGYLPSQKAALAFAILYGLSAGYHEYQISHTKPQRFTTPLSLGAFMSMAGYIARYIVIRKESDFITPWIISQVLILAAGPTYAAADYFIGARLFHFVPHAAPIKPARVVSTFLVLDVLAELLLYAGAIPMFLAKSSVGKTAGLWILRLAMCLQSVTFMGFVTIVAMFHRRINHKGLEGNWKRIIWTLYVSAAFIVTRSIYHIAETIVPHTGSFRTNEVFFLTFEAGIMLINVGMFNLVHPGFLLPPKSTTYLNEHGALTEGNDYQDTRPLLMKILDPFDIRAMRQKRREQNANANGTKNSNV